LAVRAKATLENRLEPDVLNEVSAEFANLRAALTWLAEAKQTGELLRLAGAVLWPCYLTGQLREGRAWAERALALAPDEPTADRAAAAFAAGHLAHYLGDDVAAVSRLAEAIELARHAGDLRREAFSGLLLGIVAEDAGDYARATSLFEAAQARYAQADHRRGIALATFHLDVVAYGEADSTRAAALQEEALAASRAAGDPLIEAWCLEWLVVLAAERGDLDRAAAALETRLAIGPEPRSMPLDGQLMATVVVVGAACGAHAAAARLLGTTDALQAMSGERFQLPERLVYERAAQRLRAALGPGAYEDRLTDGRTMSDVAVLVDIRTILAAASA
jgi:ATP/maltotriose-dependent transcriptional regulator MalT